MNNLADIGLGNSRNLFAAMSLLVSSATLDTGFGTSALAADSQPAPVGFTAEVCRDRLVPAINTAGQAETVGLTMATGVDPDVRSPGPIFHLSDSGWHSVNNVTVSITSAATQVEPLLIGNISLIVYDRDPSKFQDVKPLSTVKVPISDYQIVPLPEGSRVADEYGKAIYQLTRKDAGTPQIFVPEVEGGAYVAFSYSRQSSTSVMRLAKSGPGDQCDLFVGKNTKGPVTLSDGSPSQLAAQIVRFVPQMQITHSVSGDGAPELVVDCSNVAAIKKLGLTPIIYTSESLSGNWSVVPMPSDGTNVRIPASGSSGFVKVQYSR